MDDVLRARAYLAGRANELEAIWQRMPPEKQAEYRASSKPHNALAVFDRLRDALRMIDANLTTAEGDNVPRGEACKLGSRNIARLALRVGETT